MENKEGFYPYPSQRSSIYGKNGMVCASNPYAAQAGLDILKKGGNAIDAAIAVAASMPVVEPTCNGLGSDCFAIIYSKGRLHGLNASGRSPLSISIPALKDRGLDHIPSFGVVPIGTPGAVGGWMAMYEKFSTLSIEEIFEPAIDYAENGFPVSPIISKLWDMEIKNYEPFKDKKEFSGFFDTFTMDGKAPKAGEVFVNPDIGKTLREISKTKGASFYKGNIAEKIDTFIKKHGGFLTKEDLEIYSPLWVEPISTNYRGIDVWELPPNGHGISVLMALKILEKYEFVDRDSPETLHLQIEAIKLAMTDAAKYVTDPECMSVTIEDLLSDSYAKSRRDLIDEKVAIEAPPGIPHTPSTVYFCTADKYGNMVSMIQSNYRGFGSGIVVPGTGVSLNDRVENFSLEEGHDNILRGGKIPYHTIIPGFLTQGGKPLGPFGVMGGFMQPQGHLQILMNLIDFGLNPQAALDAPRFQWFGKKKIGLEAEFSDWLKTTLTGKQHNIKIQENYFDMGRGQIILRNSQGILCGGTEKRTDGYVAFY